jgi:hypothetical protein
MVISIIDVKNSSDFHHYPYYSVLLIFTLFFFLQAIYYIFNIGFVSVSVGTSVGVLNFHFRGHKVTPVPKWLKVMLFISERSSVPSDLDVTNFNNNVIAHARKNINMLNETLLDSGQHHQSSPPPPPPPTRRYNQQPRLVHMLDTTRSKSNTMLNEITTTSSLMPSSSSYLVNKTIITTTDDAPSYPPPPPPPHISLTASRKKLTSDGQNSNQQQSSDTPSPPARIRNQFINEVTFDVSKNATKSNLHTFSKSLYTFNVSGESNENMEHGGDGSSCKAIDLMRETTLVGPDDRPASRVMRRSVTRNATTGEQAAATVAAMLRKDGDEIGVNNMEMVIKLMKKTIRLLEKGSLKKTTIQLITDDWKEVASRVDFVLFIIACTIVTMSPVFLFGKFFVQDSLLVSVVNKTCSCS